MNMWILIDWMLKENVVDVQKTVDGIMLIKACDRE